MIDFIRCVPSSVESLELSVMPKREWSHCIHEDEFYGLRLTYVGLNEMDYLSTRLHNLSMRLQSLTLSHMRISKALFWPSAENSTNAPYWPKLERLRVLNVPPYNEDGSPLLGLDPPLTREAARRESLVNPPPKDRFSDRREYIKSADLGILYRAMGTAAQRMPRLQIMGLSLLNYRTGEESNESLEFSRDKSARIAHLRINTQWGYRPGMEVISAWGLEGAVAEEFYHTMDVVLPWYVEAQ
ncbi:similar to An01g06790 [Aspergillus luchuensis]|uniref:Similar to An01g06790 n=1 Tax=Aspergillus kawachii TaxID=1069201 RepID=A0A146FPW4_ASPKA|nr:similar to An01g06790 [Aspergillus luchuensis]